MAAGDDFGAKEKADGLRILHVMRAPIGGLFRHVVDLARAQAQAGHSVGVIADSTTGGDDAARTLAELAPALALGLTRLPMHRSPHPSDLGVAWRVARLIQTVEPDVVHGHGAKGGLYARLPMLLPGFPAPRRPLARVYTPHGGSLHFQPSSPAGRLIFAAERVMERGTDIFSFESDYARRRFIAMVGTTQTLTRIVHNGLAETEFAPVDPAPDAADFLFIGEMRFGKGVDTLIEAFALLGGNIRLALIGSGKDESAFRALADRKGVAERAAFLEPMRSRDAFRRGRILVVPSRHESLPYIVLEAIAAKTPVVATNVGGVPEIFGAHAARLVTPNDAAALATAMRAMLEMQPDVRRALADEMAAFVQANFTLPLMAEGVLRGYCDALRAINSRNCNRAAQLQIGG